MSVSTNIKDKIKLNIQSCASVQQVYGHEELNPTGWPAVMVTAQNMDGEFASNSENSRKYAYRLLILFPIGQDMPGQPTGTNRMEYAETVIATVIDEIINVQDTDYELANSDATVLYINASDAQWGYYSYEGGEARGAEITLTVYTEKTVV